MIGSGIYDKNRGSLLFFNIWFWLSFDVSNSNERNQLVPISMLKLLSALMEEAIKIQFSLKSPRLKIGGFFVPPPPGR
jgi:hypothetical protein